MLDKREKILAWVIIIAGGALVVYAYAIKGGLLNPDTFFGAAGSVYGIFLLIKNKTLTPAPGQSAPKDTEKDK